MVNVTMVSHVTITKMVAYVSVRFPENKNDREYRREVVRTVVDVEKVLKGMQSNPIVKGYVDDLLKYADFDINLPYKPVSKRIRILGPLKHFF